MSARRGVGVLVFETGRVFGRGRYVDVERVLLRASNVYF
jgi:hypothetical protein